MQSLVFALAYGSMYSLLALAIGIISSTTGIVNFAHGSVVMVATMTAYRSLLAGVPYLGAVAIGMGVAIVLNFLIYKCCVERLGDLHTNIGWIITLFGAGLLIDNLARIIFGLNVNSFPRLFNDARINFFGANIYLHEVAMIVIAAVIGIAYQMMCTKTKVGRALRAVSIQPQTARLMGIDSDLMIMLAFSLSGVVAAITGCLIAPYTKVSYVMTSSVAMKGFAAAMIGGFGNTAGAFVGGLALGILEQLLTFAGVPPTLINASSFIVMIIVLIFLPGGLINAKYVRLARRKKAKKV